ncbi:hypothetical protein N9237_02845 [Akkermansiaceae bacterium]|nr:hypothetical protein [Akkermansiaceae bacterium]
MANPTITNSSYAGEFAGKYLGSALLSASTLDAGAITILPNIKYKAAMKVGTFSNLVRSADCDFDATTSGLTLTEKVLTPSELQVNLQICKKELHSDWEAAQMGFSAFDELPPLFSDYVIARVAAEVANATENSIWSGAAGEGSFDGFLQVALADGDVHDITAVAITSGNVIAQMGAVIDKAVANAPAILGKEDLTLYVSTNVAQSYIRSLGGFTATIGGAGTDNKGTQWYNGGALSFEGVNIFVAKGFGSNKMLLSPKSNLFFGTGLLDDRNEVRVIDMADTDGSQNVRVVMRYTAGVQIGVGSSIVLYS